MRGYPKHINTRKDMDNLISLFPVQAKADLQRMLDSRYAWQVAGEVVAPDTGLDDATHKVVVDDDGTQWQMELQEDQHCQLFRLGYTVADAESIIGGL